MKWINIVSLFFLTSCVYLSEPLTIDDSNVKEIRITNRRDSSLSIKLTDPILIKGLLRDCINGARREPLKFMVNYQLDVKEVNTSYTIYVNGRNLNRGGDTYKSSCNVENKIKELFSR